MSHELAGLIVLVNTFTPSHPKSSLRLPSASAPPTQTTPWSRKVVVDSTSNLSEPSPFFYYQAIELTSLAASLFSTIRLTVSCHSISGPPWHQSWPTVEDHVDSTRLVRTRVTLTRSWYVGLVECHMQNDLRRVVRFLIGTDQERSRLNWGRGMCFPLSCYISKRALHTFIE